MKNPRKLVAAATALVIASSLTGCSLAAPIKEVYPDPVNTPLEINPKWINSSIEGAIDSTLEVSPKDDFYTSVAKDWILETEFKEDESQLGPLNYTTVVVEDRKLSILKGEKDPEANEEITIEIDKENAEHCRELVQRMFAEVNDFDSHTNDILKPYIDHIMAISTMDELSAYISDEDGMNTTKTNFIKHSVYPGFGGDGYSRVMIQSTTEFVLGSAKSYLDTTIPGKKTILSYQKFLKKVLTGLGYSEEQADKIADDYIKLDSMIALHAPAESRPSNIWVEDFKKSYTTEEMDALSGAYPFTAVATDLGINGKDIRCIDPEYMKYLGKIYNSSNLELFKSYLIALTVIKNGVLLDNDTLSDYFAVTNGEPYYKSDYVVSDEKFTKHDENNAKDIVENSMTTALDIVYLSDYCTPELKAQITDIINDVLDYYHTMILEETWLSDGAKDKIIEKLDCMIVRAVYPDRFPDLTGFVFNDDDSAIEMMHKARSFHNNYISSFADVPSEDADWMIDDELSPTEVNSAYIPDENSINIYAGYLPVVYNENDSYETRLGSIGVTIGHEITHAFDSNGMKYDKHGAKKNLVDLDDMGRFDLRTNEVSKFYDKVAIYPSCSTTPLYGQQVMAEEIADMGGIKAILGIAKNVDGFDYEQFFTSFAEGWKTKQKLKTAELYYRADVHPPFYFRVNIGVSQFDEFAEAFDVHEGDGMYVAPENRINVW